jgi:hypothetical protein
MPFVSNRVTTLLGLLVVLNVCGRCAAHSDVEVEAQQHAAILSQEISQMAFNATTKYLNLSMYAQAHVSNHMML